ncbi:MAG: PEGA domain-containing protein [Spirochaetales bacterium]|nr:PEGA domain-containing protein [Spirochaetales bacterium]
MKRIPFNPYIVGNPIKTKGMFFGREDDFSFVQKKIGESVTNQILVFCGDRRSGKTSILFQILNGTLGKRFLPVLVDMQLMAGIQNDDDFFHTILKIAASSIGIPKLEKAINEKPEKRKSVDELFHILFTHIGSKYTNRTILFLLDEYELIEAKITDGSISESVIHYLSGILESNYKISFIFTGSTNLESRNVDYWKTFLGKSIYRKISYLSERDTNRLITEPLKEYVTYSPKVVSEIYRLTGGQPFYTQVLCQNIVDKLIEEERFEPDSGDLKSVVREVVDNPLPQMIYSWNSYPSHIRLILSCIAGTAHDGDDWVGADKLWKFLRKSRLKTSFPREQILVYLEDAYHHEILEKNDQEQYRFRMDLFRRWIKREHTIWKTAKEENLKFRRRFRLLNAAAIFTVLIGIIAAWIWLRAPDEEQVAPQSSEPQQIVHELTAEETSAKNVLLIANIKPFRVVINGKLSLTSEGLEDESRITLPSIEKGIHSILFINGLAEEEKSAEVEILEDNQEILVEFSITRKPVKIVAAKGSLFLTSDPPGAAIFLDGQDSGFTTPNLFEDLGAGNHIIRITLEGHSPVEREILIPKDETLREEIILEATFGELLLDVRPTAKIYLDGDFLVETPYIKAIAVQTGIHTLTIKNEALNVDRSMNILIREGDPLKITEVLK